MLKQGQHLHKDRQDLPLLPRRRSIQKNIPVPFADHSRPCGSEKCKFKNNGKACNNKTTRAIIYPKSPYGKKDYKVEVELDCGFDKKAETK